MTLDNIKTITGLALVLGSFIAFLFFDFLSNTIKFSAMLSFGIGVLALISKRNLNHSSKERIIAAENEDGEDV